MTLHVFYVTGTHCPACKILIEDVLMECDDVQSASVDLRRGQLQIISTTPNHAMEEWSALLQPYGYRLYVEKPATSQLHTQRIYAIMAGVALLGLFFWMQEANIFSFSITQPLTAKTALMVGVVASFSSCLAVVGGLVLSLSAQVAHDASTLRPLIFFHLIY